MTGNDAQELSQQQLQEQQQQQQQSDRLQESALDGQKQQGPDGHDDPWQTGDQQQLPDAGRLDWNQPRLDGASSFNGPARRGSKSRKLIVAALLLGLLAGGGWYALNHHAKPKRLPGMDRIDAPVKAIVAKAADKPASQAVPAPVADQPPDFINPLAPVADQPRIQTDSPARPEMDQVAKGDLLADVPNGGSLPQSAEPVTTLAPVLAGSSAQSLASARPLPMVAGSGMVAAPPDTLAAASAAVAALPSALPVQETPPSIPPAVSGATPAAFDVLQQRVQHLEDAIVAMQTRLDRDGARPGMAGEPGAAAPVSATPVRRAQRRPRVRAVQPVPAASVAQPVPAAPALGQQLLSIDMWGGTPSVVMTSGLPGDTRTRTLRPGDTLNGVTLRTADPATGRATFMSGGQRFTLSLGNGG